MKLFLILWCVLGITSSVTRAMIIPFDDPEFIVKILEYDSLFGRSNYTYSRAKQKLVFASAQVPSVGVVKPTQEQINTELDEECVACFESYDTQARERIKLLCDAQRKIEHSICKQCLIAWAAKSSLCPTCEHPFVLDAIIKPPSVIKPSLFKRFVALFSLVACAPCAPSSSE